MTNSTAVLEFDSSNTAVNVAGDWNLRNIGEMQKLCAKVKSIPGKTLTLNGQALQQLDSAGAWLLNVWLNKQRANNCELTVTDLSEQHQQLLKLVADQIPAASELPKKSSLPFLANIGFHTIAFGREFLSYFNFIGLLAIDALRILFNPTRWRFGAIVNVVDKTGWQALPIIALLSFMIGVVMAYQMGSMLKSYGANIFIVDLLGLSILREFAPLLTAIMVAGRTGSAFTAELGIMKINQEIDALTTLGITSTELLLLPRILGLLIALPLLTIWSDIFGILGGMVMAHNLLGLTWYDFLNRFEHNIPVRALVIGLGKTPIFALLIGSIALLQGMQVQSSADSVGKQTTKSVVLAIFFIIIADALFSILFSKFGL
jgi:phospholipid/cholesterol/gamma-HCH transport system permease protein